MKPETRIALAERLGWTNIGKFSDQGMAYYLGTNPVNKSKSSLPAFDTSYDSGSRLLVEKLREEGWTVELSNLLGGWECWLCDGNSTANIPQQHYVRADTLPLAISRAACRVWGIKEDGE